MRWPARVCAALLPCWLLLSSSVGVPAATVQQPVPRAAQPLNEPRTVTTGAESFAISDQRLVWNERFTCGEPPLPRAMPDQVIPAKSVFIKRVPTYGGAPRTLHERILLGQCPESSIPFRSPLELDAQYVYWLAADVGLVRLSVEANPGDTPEVMTGALAGDERGQLVRSGQYIYGYKGIHLFRVLASGPNAGEALATTAAPISDLQVTTTHLYYIMEGILYRRALDTGTTSPIAAGVSAYHAEGERRSCLTCTPTDSIYIVQGNRLSVYNNRTGTFGAESYTAPHPIVFIAGSFSRLFVMEKHPVPCDSSPCPSRFRWHLVRLNRTPAAPETLYISEPDAFPRQLATSDGFVYWIDGQFSKTVRRLPIDASALPVTNLYPTAIEVTQGVQTPTNSLRLIQQRRTFVRVFASTPSPAPVAGVTMDLMVTGASGAAVRLSPINSLGTNLTVHPAPDPYDINQAFLFEVPLTLTSERWLRFRAVLNPNQFPLEPDYSDNTLETSLFFLHPSPPLMVQFVSFSYTIGGTSYRTRLIEDVLYNASYIRRTYPLASRSGGFGDRTPGLRTNWWSIYDEGVGERIFQSNGTIIAPECAKRPFYYQEKNEQGDLVWVDDRNSCASAYVNSRLRQMRANTSLSDAVFLYGMIPSGAGFPRGQEGGGNTSSGPAGDGYRGYYAAHEIAHSLGRQHPVAGSGADDPATPQKEGCGHTASDPAFTSALSGRAPLGVLDAASRGFDVGDAQYNELPGVPSVLANDYMSYCKTYWISDYTYKGLYDRLTNSVPVRVQAAPAQNGAWLSVYGAVASGGAVIHDARYATSGASSGMVAPEDAPFLLHLVDSAGRMLATYGLETEAGEDADGVQGFGITVPFVAGTRAAQIVERVSGQTLDARSISTSAPTIADVRLIDTPEPVTGPARLVWNASDPDGDRLTYDVFWSRDGSDGFVPVHLGSTTPAVTLDTATLGGGRGVFRVLAHDGFRTAEARSVPVTVAAKAPVVQITSPMDGAQVAWNQLVTFSADTLDVQDGVLADAALVWKDAAGNTLGTGSVFATDALPVGTNRITLTATNSSGLAASAGVTVVVRDRIAYPGPTLAITPARIEWVATGEAPAPQTWQVQVQNIGGGTLNWSATSDQPWLTIDTTSGTGAATLTLRAAPTQIPRGQRAIATITWNVTGGESVQTQVIIERFNAFTGEDVPVAAAPVRSLFVPLIRR